MFNFAQEILLAIYSRVKIIYGVWQEISDSCALETAIIQLYIIIIMGIVYACTHLNNAFVHHR